MADPSPSLPSLTALICFPGAAYTQKCALDAAKKVLQPKGWTVVDGCKSAGGSDPTAYDTLVSAPKGASAEHALYFTDYDLLPFEQLLGSKHQQCSSYVIRKALIRKHHLAHSIHAHSLKIGPQAIPTHLPLTPRTWFFELQFADDLDELLMDELYDLRDSMQAQEDETQEAQWFILKPGMADRGNGIRLFRDEDGLRSILEELEGGSEEDASEAGSGDEAGGGMLGQLRHFVIQEYIRRPLLLAPRNVDATERSERSDEAAPSRKFHIRAYVLCTGGLQVYLWDDMLALFAPLAYRDPTSKGDAASEEPDPRIHLTNTCLHADGQPSADGRPAEENVYLLENLVGCTATDGKSQASTGSFFTPTQYERIKSLTAQTIGRTFEAAARAGSIHWQTWPNAWEIFGVDLLVGWDPEACSPGDEALRVWLLEVNAQPDFAQSGARLSSTIESLFRRSIEVAVLPFFEQTKEGHERSEPRVGTSQNGMTLCLDAELSRAW